MKIRIRTPRAAHCSASSSTAAMTMASFLENSSRSLRWIMSRGWKDMWGISAEVLSNRSLDLSFRNRPHHPPALHAIFEEHQQRNAVYAE